MSAGEPTADAQGGEEFGRYTIYGKIAAGGMASVFLGRERENARRWVAIKRVHPHLIARRDVVQMFLNEAKLLSRLDHPNICGIIDFGIQQDSPYIVMRYLHGVPLSSLLRRLIDQKKELPVAPVASIAIGKKAAPPSANMRVIVTVVAISAASMCVGMSPGNRSWTAFGKYSRRSTS